MNDKCWVYMHTLHGWICRLDAIYIYIYIYIYKYIHTVYKVLTCPTGDRFNLVLVRLMCKLKGYTRCGYG